MADTPASDIVKFNLRMFEYPQAVTNYMAQAYGANQAGMPSASDNILFGAYEPPKNDIDQITQDGAILTYISSANVDQKSTGNNAQIDFVVTIFTDCYAFSKYDENETSVGRACQQAQNMAQELTSFAFAALTVRTENDNWYGLTNPEVAPPIYATSRRMIAIVPHPQDMFKYATKLGYAYRIQITINVMEYPVQALLGPDLQSVTAATAADAPQI